VTTDLEQAKAQYELGKRAFEGGEYRQSVEALERAVGLANPNSALGGEMQTWLVTAYQAAGRLTEAIALCEQLGQHPDLKTRQQGKRLLYILQAPQLKTRPEWLTQIPDLTAINSEGERPQPKYGSTTPKPIPAPEPVDLSQVNTKDNRFVWVALVLILLLGGGLLWLSR
jgi:tetratricopeptide (TPR) repeat protein